MKYKLTSEVKEYEELKLYRIEALIDFGVVKKGEKGGFIEKIENLSQDGNAWVYGDATPEEITRLDAVREIVLKKPERLYMRTWHKGDWTPDHTPEEEHTCGSAHCIAGWLQALSPDLEIRKMDPYEAGCKLAPSVVHMFCVSDATALQWLENREYAKIAQAAKEGT